VGWAAFAGASAEREKADSRTARRKGERGMGTPWGGEGVGNGLGGP
jgi:hypothetical protein